MIFITVGNTASYPNTAPVVKRIANGRMYLLTVVFFQVQPMCDKPDACPNIIKGAMSEQRDRFIQTEIGVVRLIEKNWKLLTVLTYANFRALIKRKLYPNNELGPPDGSSGFDIEEAVANAMMNAYLHFFKWFEDSTKCSKSGTLAPSTVAFSLFLCF